MDARLLEALVELLVLQVRKKQRAWMELRTRLLHFGETTVVIVDVGITAGAIGVVDDASVPLHVLAVEVSWRRGGCCKNIDRHVSESRRAVRKHFE